MESPPGLAIEETVRVGRNDGWEFGVGRIGGRWIGFAVGVEPVEDPAGPTRYMHLFPQVSEGYELGTPDRDKAVRLVGALAQDPEHGFGGVAEWFVPPGLRANPDEFRCKWCDDVGCDGVECAGGEFDDDSGIPE